MRVADDVHDGRRVVAALRDGVPLERQRLLAAQVSAQPVPVLVLDEVAERLEHRHPPFRARLVVARRHVLEARHAPLGPSVHPRREHADPQREPHREEDDHDPADVGEHLEDRSSASARSCGRLDPVGRLSGAVGGVADRVGAGRRRLDRGAPGALLDDALRIEVLAERSRGQVGGQGRGDRRDDDPADDAVGQQADEGPEHVRAKVSVLTPSCRGLFVQRFT